MAGYETNHYLENQPLKEGFEHNAAASLGKITVGATETTELAPSQYAEYIIFTRNSLSYFNEHHIGTHGLGGFNTSMHSSSENPDHIAQNLLFIASACIRNQEETLTLDEENIFNRDLDERGHQAIEHLFNLLGGPSLSAVTEALNYLADQGSKETNPRIKREFETFRTYGLKKHMYGFRDIVRNY